MQKDRLGVFGLGLVLTFVGFFVAYQFVEPAPPSTLRIATGGASGAYAQFGARYRDLLAAEGIALEVVHTAGSVENLGLLENSAKAVDVAFVQGGTAKAAKGTGLTALGSLYFEPFWVFSRQDVAVSDLRDLAGLRLAVGGEGSGTRAVALHLLEEVGIGPDQASLLPLGGGAAHRALNEGEVDALMTVASPLSKVVDGLLRDPGVTPMSFARGEALALRNRFLSSLRLPRGSIDLARDIPGDDLALVAPAATLVARADLHPALATLLLQVVERVHSSGGMFEEPDAFPSTRFVEFPVSDEARRFFSSGPPFLQRYLPFWAADLIDRLKVMLIPLLALLMPLAKLLPPVYQWRVRSRVFHWYRDLLEIESQARGTDDAATLDELRHRLTAIEQEVQRVSVPLSHAEEAFNLRIHIALVRETLGA
jgi:uncharacterized protein